MVPLAVAQAGDEVLLETSGLGCLSTFVELMDGPHRLPIVQFGCLYNQTRSPGMHDVVRGGL